MSELNEGAVCGVDGSLPETLSTSSVAQAT